MKLTSIKKASTAPNITLPHICNASEESVNLNPYSLAAIAVPEEEIIINKNISTYTSLIYIVIINNK